jgi:type IV secretory pathway TrbD component
VDFYNALSYFTGLHFIDAGLGGQALLRTAALVHLLDAILCGLIAGQSGRSKKIWTVAGFGLGIWALATIFLLPAKKRE